MKMKKIQIIIAQIVMLLIAMPIQAQNCRFPAYTPTHYTLAMDLELDSMSMYKPDSSHRVCGLIFSYDLMGMVPSEDDGRIISITGGNQNPASENTPIAALCRLLQAYRSHSLENIKQQYRPEDRIKFDQLFAQTAVANRYIAMTSLIEEMKLLLTYDKDGYTFAVVTCFNHDTVWSIAPFGMQQVAGQWYAAIVSDKDSNNAITPNLIAFFENFGVSDFISAEDIDDVDGDGVLNSQDNCTCKYNPDQSDIDGDGVGDVCDNCPQKVNPDQTDYDEDGYGDVCDNCRIYYNPDQTDSDGDGVGDSCDNCKFYPNPKQLDSDYDGIGDDCDDDIDGDDIPNEEEEDGDMDGDDILDSEDNCPIHYNPDQLDSDGDGIGDACDNCPYIANPNQEDAVNNGYGDVCDPDCDGDGIPNERDNCPNVPNPDQLDTDCDGFGDACDPDRDGDGVPNESDNCPDTFNPDQQDTNQNGIGDMCE